MFFWNKTSSLLLWVISNMIYVTIWIMLKLIPRWSTNSFEKHLCGNTSKKFTYNTPDFQMLAPILMPFAWFVPGLARVFFVTCFSETSQRAPLGPILASSRASLVRFCRLAGRIEAQFCSKCQRFQSSKWHQSHLKKYKQGFKQTLPIINPNKYFSCLT